MDTELIMLQNKNVIGVFLRPGEARTDTEPGSFLLRNFFKKSEIFSVFNLLVQMNKHN